MLWRFFPDSVRDMSSFINFAVASVPRLVVLMFCPFRGVSVYVRNIFTFLGHKPDSEPWPEYDIAEEDDPEDRGDIFRPWLRHVPKPQKRNVRHDRKMRITIEDVLIAKQGDRAVLVIRHEFRDVPAWLEWDPEMNGLTLAMTGGGIADLAPVIPSEEEKEFYDLKRMLLVVNFGGRNVMHNIAFIVRQKTQERIAA